MKGIGELVKLFNSEHQEVQRFATGATRNIIFESMDNKVELIEEGGIPQLIEALRENDDELRKNITGGKTYDVEMILDVMAETAATPFYQGRIFSAIPGCYGEIQAFEKTDPPLSTCAGILWNLSSKDNLKQKLARETLPELTEKILIPLSQQVSEDQLSSSEGEIFYNTTGCLRCAFLPSSSTHLPLFSPLSPPQNRSPCLSRSPSLPLPPCTCRNLSSVNEKTRQQMRETQGLVDALVGYIKSSLDDNKAEDKVRRGGVKGRMEKHALTASVCLQGVENALCILRNLSYQLYHEIPPSALMRLEGPTRGQDSGKGEAIGCFTPQSRKAKNVGLPLPSVWW